MNRRLAKLRAPDVHLCPSEVDIAPFQVAALGRPQTMSPDRKQHRIISVPVAIAFRGFEELFAFGLGQILAFAGNCPLFCGWRSSILAHVLLAGPSLTVRIPIGRRIVSPARNFAADLDWAV